MTKLFIALSVFAVITMSASVKGQIAGGLGSSKPADADVNELVERLRESIIKQICDKKLGDCPSSDAKIEVNSYKTQTVAGVNYFVDVTIGEANYHVRIFSQPWTHTEEVHGVEGPKEKGTEIKYFV